MKSLFLLVLVLPPTSTFESIFSYMLPRSIFRAPLRQGVRNIWTRRMTTSVSGGPTTDTNIEQIVYKNKQSKFPIDEMKIKYFVKCVKKYLEIEKYQVELNFLNDIAMRKHSKEFLNKSKSTDVVSVQSFDINDPDVNSIELEMSRAIFRIGSITICPAYVHRQLLRDKKYFEEDRLDLDDDRGVSKEMATKFNIEDRYFLLIIHSFLHIMGYDHENDQDWMNMTKKEDEVIDEMVKLFPSIRDKRK